MVSKIGRGSTATVFRAIKRSTGSFAALKRVKIQNKTIQTMIYTEIVIMQLSRHPNIVEFQ